MKKSLFPKLPLCEECMKKPATSFSFFEREDREDIPKDDLGFGRKVLTGERLKKAIEGDPEIMREIKESADTTDAIFERYNLKHKCRFTCECTSHKEVYYIGIEGFFKSPDATLGWMCQLQEKIWFDPKDFFNMMVRFKKVASISGHLPHD